ncbi:amidophosphoribosyltransferase [Candidatus Galacturonibacter soehngenii]|uniref:Amidophosphoribosyltransferase n=1 Tax=Candidatus Galacturonatibacter soehngenii TaxID=2307010 RepID=A0A7V7UDL3_9FIRM|nr:amidophosphoribosyltransferase [Candidatus Galacturonibacter soehngenii]KAB1440656.1 amidophosphoribosyltransferase [Candidatus Galacturonibacter soehngenii]MBA4688249.1 amidophosphoribosyltransferase [Candidatus Galacturonibacter soehngenii]
MSNRIHEQYDLEDELHEECGVFGMYDFDGGDVASTIYYGLFALQHRGQESCGIAVSETDGPKGRVSSFKGMGLVNEVFTPETLEGMKGDIGVGHVRYSTAGSSTRENAQPLVLNYVKGTLALAHNGNLINALQLRHELEYTGAIFQTTIDSEVIAYHIARERLNTKSVEDAVIRAMKKIQGAYSLIVMSPRKLIGARDPHGFKPLCIGKRDNSYIITSESCALETVDAEFVRDVLPGEVVTITPDGIFSDTSMCKPKEKEARCIFEYIYFARPDSHIDGVSVYHSRILAGKYLAMDSPVEADLVVGVPESGNAAALGYSLQSGIPYGTAFVKNGYVGRTFIKPKQSNRESSVRVKLNVLAEAVKGKRVIMIDDSIVRGTTSDRIVGMLKEAGATEVHVRVSSPPFLYPCYFGTDIPSREQLIAYNRSVDDIKKVIGADSLAYLEINRLGEMVEQLPHCTGCFTGKYPMDPPTIDIRGEYQK